MGVIRLNLFSISLFGCIKGHKEFIAVEPTVFVQNQTGAFAYLVSAFKKRDSWLFLSVQDIRLRYRRSILGPFWITISMAVFSFSIGIVYSQLFNAKLEEYLPYLTVSIIIWTFISSSINESTSLYLDNSVYIKDLNVNVLTINLRALSRQLIILGHNMIVVAAVILLFRLPMSLTIVSSVFAVGLLFLFLFFVASCLSLIGARFRDVSQLTSSLVQVMFFLTPVTWEVSFLKGNEWIFIYNPIYHYIDIIRGPLLGRSINPTSWAICIGLAVLAWLIQFQLFSRKVRRVAFWV
jgi:ABC-type polysaccharide/polyol phosphate export permease